MTKRPVVDDNASRCRSEGAILVAASVVVIIVDVVVVGVLSSESCSRRRYLCPTPAALSSLSLSAASRITAASAVVGVVSFSVSVLSSLSNSGRVIVGVGVWSRGCLHHCCHSCRRHWCRVVVVIV